MERNCTSEPASRRADGMMSFLRHSRVKHFLVVFLLTLVFWLLDPFSSATNSARLSEALFYWIIAPTYPEPLKDAQATDEFNDDTQMAVIVMNDATLAAENVTWPPPFRIHERILKKIFDESSPRAVFIDFGFFDRRDAAEVQALATLLGSVAVPKTAFEGCMGIEQIGRGEANCQWRVSDGGQVPIFLTGLPEGGLLDVLPELKKVVSGVVSTRYIGDDLATYNQYELFDCQANLPSPALALYLVGSEQPLPEGIRANGRCVEKILDGEDRSDFEPKLSVFWADWGTETEGRGLLYSCRTLPPHVGSRVSAILWDWWVEDIWRPIRSILPGANNLDAAHPAARRQTCPPAREATAHDFLADQSGRMSAFLYDRYVFYGAKFLMADDLIRPPTHEPIPGVYLHAMVLDNLLRGQHKFAKSGWKSLGLTLLAMALAAACSAWSWAKFDAYAPTSQGAETPAGTMSCRRGDGTAATASTLRETSLNALGACGRRLKQAGKSCWDSRRWGRSISWVLLGLGLCFGLIVAIAFGAFFYADLAPVNFVGILSLIGLDAGVRGAREFLDRVF